MTLTTYRMEAASNIASSVMGRGGPSNKVVNYEGEA